jgi:hypothetical protein
MNKIDNSEGGDDAGFGINQLFGEGSSTAAANGADEGVEQGRTGQQILLKNALGNRIN